MPLGRARSVGATSQKNLGRWGKRGGRRCPTGACEEGSWNLEVVERDPGMRGFSIQPRRWVVENTQS